MKRRAVAISTVAGVFVAWSGFVWLVRVAYRWMSTVTVVDGVVQPLPWGRVLVGMGTLPALGIVLFMASAAAIDWMRERS